MFDIDVILCCLPAGVLLCVEISSDNLTEFLIIIYKNEIMHIHKLIIGRDQ